MFDRIVPISYVHEDIKIQGNKKKRKRKSSRENTVLGVSTVV